MTEEIVTCSRSLWHPGMCCEPTCGADAVSAVIDWDMCEHARCAEHDHGEKLIGKKPLIWNHIWGPA